VPVILDSTPDVIELPSVASQVAPYRARLPAHTPLEASSRRSWGKCAVLSALFIAINDRSLDAACLWLMIVGMLGQIILPLGCRNRLWYLYLFRAD